MKIKQLSLSDLIALLLFIGVMIIFVESMIQKQGKPAVFYINSKTICQTYGIDKDKCKIKTDYYGENKGFYKIKINKNGKTEEEYINKNAVELINLKK